MKITPILLCALLAFSVSACRRNETPETPESRIQRIDAENAAMGIRIVAENRAAAKRGDVKAQYRVGRWNKEDNFPEALKLIRRAAEQNHLDAQWDLSQFYDGDVPGMEDKIEAVKWCRKAAEQDHRLAQFSMGCYYSLGKSVQQDPVEALAWFILSAQKEKEKSGTMMSASDRRDDLMKKLSPQKVAEAESRAKELHAQIEAKLKSGVKIYREWE